MARTPDTGFQPRGIEISNAAGVPVQRGPRTFPSPDLPTPKRKQNHTGRNLALGLGGAAIVAAGLGYAAINSGHGTGPQATDIPGGIVEPSASPSPKESIVIKPSSTPGETFIATLPPASPDATPTQTPDVTPTPSPELKSVKALIEAKHPAVAAGAAKKTVADLVKKYPEVENSYPGAVPNITDCTDTNLTFGDRTAACVIEINNLYGFYKSTGNIDFYNAALRTYNYAKSHLSKANMAYINQYLEQFN